MLQKIADKLVIEPNRVLLCTGYVWDLPALMFESSEEDFYASYIVPLEGVMVIESARDAALELLAGMQPGLFQSAGEQSFEVTKAHSNTKNAERYGNGREQILGAALAVLASYPDRCKTRTGKIMGAKIAKIVFEKEPLFFEEGEPPMNEESASRLINSWLKKTR